MSLCLLAVCVTSGALSGCYSNSNDPVLQVYVAPAAGHDHVAAFTYQEMRSGVRVFPMSDNLGHNHTVTITDVDVANIDFAFPVTVTSSFEMGHAHAVTIQKMQFKQ
ncbi:MAG: hypothetical protein HY042_10260 [Spirochaetia bacterium]|nr:hypothetical protein [Spirochaetia bacterium]